MTFHDPWLIIILRAAAESGCPSVVAEVLRRADLPHLTLQHELLVLVKNRHCNRGHIEVAGLLLQNMDEDCKSELSLLHLAAAEGSALMVDLLLKHTEDVNARCDHKACTPLHLALGDEWFHKHEVAQRLIEEESVDVNVEDIDRKTPLFYACNADCISCVESLLLRGVKIDSGKVPPLCRAAQKPKTDIMRLLMQKGASVNVPDEYGTTPLHYATYIQRIEAVHLLLVGGADVHLRNKNGQTALDMAHDCLAIVLENFVNCNTRIDREKQLAHLQLIIDLKAAALRGSPQEVSEILRQSNFSPSELNVALWASLEAKSQGSTEVTRILEEYQAGCVQTLPMKTVDINEEDHYGKTPLCYAKDISSAESLLLQGAKVDGGTVPPLCLAAGNNNTNLMRFLMQKGASVNATDGYEWSPLHHSVIYGGVEAVQVLLSGGADIHLRNKSGLSALDLAIEWNKEEIVIVLEKITNSVTRIDRKKQLEHLPLIVDLKAAAQRGSPEEVREILQQSNFSPSELKIALLASSKGESRGHTDVTRILLEHGAECDQSLPSMETTPLHNAAEGGNVDSLNLLLSKFEDVNKKDFKGQSPLHVAIGRKPSEHRHEATQRLLQNVSVDINVEDIFGETPLCFALFADCISCTELLLLRGANVDGNVISPLCKEARENSTTIMRLLLKNGARVNARDDVGRTALHYAVKYKMKDYVQLLLLEGADASIRDSKRKTALDIAIRGGEEQIASILRKQHSF